MYKLFNTTTGAKKTIVHPSMEDEEEKEVVLDAMTINKKVKASVSNTQYLRG